MPRVGLTTTLESGGITGPCSGGITGSGLGMSIMYGGEMGGREIIDKHGRV